jgi:hypothetical protein
VFLQLWTNGRRKRTHSTKKKFPLGADLRCHLSIGDATVSWNFWNVGEARNADIGLAKVVSMMRPASKFDTN